MALTMALLAGVALAVPSSAQEVLVPAAVTMTATPDTMLVQGDDVTVTGSGAEPNSFVGIAQCLVGASGLESCSPLSGYTNATASGNFATVTTPRRILRISGVDHDCADVSTCELAAIGLDDGPASILATAAIQFDPSIPPPPPPTITATPSTGLVQGDVVELVGAGFTPNASVVVLQCLASASPDQCDSSNLQFFPADGSGGFTRSVTPLRIIYVGNTAHDCALEACVLAAGSIPEGALQTEVSIQFDPNVPPPPPPTITVTPAQGLQDGQTVTVTGVGFQPNSFISVVQCGNPSQDTGANCDLRQIGGVQVGGDGTFSHEMKVLRVFETQNGTVDCTGAERCVIGAGTGPGRGDTAPISFAAAPAGGGGTGAARAVSGDPSYAG
ncbi:MAG TPA: enediyne antibiotic chromoprotein [Acidimicrobiales bacterium]